VISDGKYRRALASSNLLFHIRQQDRIWARRERKWEIARAQKKVNRNRFREASYIRLFPKVKHDDYHFTRRYRSSAADLQRQFRLMACERVAKKMDPANDR